MVKEDSGVCGSGETIPLFQKTDGGSFEVTSNVGDGERIDKERPRQDSKDVKLTYPSLEGPDRGAASTVSSADVKNSTVAA